MALGTRFAQREACRGCEWFRAQVWGCFPSKLHQGALGGSDGSTGSASATHPSMRLPPQVVPSTDEETLLEKARGCPACEWWRWACRSPGQWPLAPVLSRG